MSHKLDNPKPKHCDCKEQEGDHKKILTDDILFKQPEKRDYGECPICFDPLPIDGTECFISACCCQRICKSCGSSNQKRELDDGLTPKCPYCRHPAPTSQMEARMMFRKMEGTAGIRNNPFAVARIGLNRFEEGDYRGAFKHWTKAAGLGDVQSHHYLSIMYHLELGVEQDKEREVYHLEQAAIAGHATARFNLGCHELKEGNVERAVKHFTIAAKQGNDESLSNLSTLSQHGIDVGDFDAIVRAYSSVQYLKYAT